MTTTWAPATASASGMPDLRAVCVMTVTFSFGVNLAASRSHAATTLVGATTSMGAAGVRLSSSRARSAMVRVCSVLPSPMSSARMPPSRWSQRNDSHW